MAKVTDITEKLDFEENPKLKIKNTEIEINTDAPTILKLMQVVGDGDNITPNDVVKMYELLFNEKERAKIDKLKLKFKDFQTLVREAMDIVLNGNNSGE